MANFTEISAEIKKHAADAKKAFDAIQSPVVKTVVGVLIALIVLMVVWAVLPWIGFIIAFAVVALIAKAVWPHFTKP